MYEFMRVQCHPKLPDLHDWYLKIGSWDLPLIEKCHTSVTSNAFVRYNSDPHLFVKDESGSFVPRDVIAEALHPLKIGTGWIKTAMKLAGMANYFLMNSAGGMRLPPLDPAHIKEVVKKESIQFPTPYEGEEISISRYPEAKHYYLKSTKGRLFVPQKYDTIEEARAEALKHVDKDRIKEVPVKFALRRGGD